MIKGVLFAAALCLLAAGFAFADSVSAQHKVQPDAQSTVQPSAQSNVSTTGSVTFAPSNTPPNVCNGPSPDPQAAADGFTSPVYCIDFTQETLPANWLDCTNSGFGNDGAPGYLLYANFFPGTGNTSCAGITHEVDPLTGQLALHIHVTAVTAGTAEKNYLAVYSASCVYCQGGVGNYFGNGWLEYTWRYTTTPQVPSPQYVTPNAMHQVWDNINTVPSNGNNIEEDWSEMDTFYNPCCWGSTVGTTNAGPMGGSFIYVGSGTWNPNLYTRTAIRTTGDPSGNGNYGLTGYQWQNGALIQNGGYIVGAGGSQAGSQIVGFQIQNNASHCTFNLPGNNFAGPCVNVPITNVYQCPSGVANIDPSKTCITTSVVTDGTSSQGQTFRSNWPLFIQGGSGIAGLNGLHYGYIPVHWTGGGYNGDTDYELVDLPWPGGSYGGGAVYNPQTSSDLWISSIQYWSCPGYDLTHDYKTNFCDGTVLSGSP